MLESWISKFQNFITYEYHCQKNFTGIFFLQCISLPSQNLRRFNMVTGCYCLSIVWKNHSVNLRSCAAAVWDSSWSRMLSLLNDCTSASKSAFSFLSYQNKHTSYIWLWICKCSLVLWHYMYSNTHDLNICINLYVMIYEAFFSLRL